MHTAEGEQPRRRSRPGDAISKAPSSAPLWEQGKPCGFSLIFLVGGVVVALPESPDAFADATWEDIAPYYEALATSPLDRANVEAWLADWSLFESLLSEAGALASFAYSCDTSDPARDAAPLKFGTQIPPKARDPRGRLQ